MVRARFSLIGCRFKWYWYWTKVQYPLAHVRPILDFAHVCSEIRMTTSKNLLIAMVRAAVGWPYVSAMTRFRAMLPAECSVQDPRHTVRMPGRRNTGRARRSRP
ncbi:hypothetical protein BN2476_110186 [Paraburkholderia piptadeniae]|uniref:Uncharacterized protein n=1 Tax=Paraburkholderia piptadeniae TaxID=1701573 RepID=A0A1N7RQ54_9BURK|nr:hypothetical protein BN2476_110186 [Paraburkholderia piptadeniae]